MQSNAISSNFSTPNRLYMHALYRFKSAFLLILLLSSALALAACGSDTTATSSKNGVDGGGDGGAGSDVAAGDTATPDSATTDSATTDSATTDSATTDSGPAKTNTLLKDGAYFVGIKLSLAGTQLRLKAVISAEGEAGKGGKLLKMDIFGMGASDDWLSPKPIGVNTNVVVKADGSFAADFGKITIPAESSPTGTAVDTNLTIAGTIDSKINTFCGVLKGDIPAFEADLAGSTFAAVPFGKQAKPYAVSCTTTVKIYTGIKSCPTLKAGANTFTSAETDRNFILHLPAAATGTAKLPIVFVYHGNGSSAAKMMTATGWPQIQQKSTTDPFIVVAPNTAALVNGQKPVLAWRFGEKVFDMDNRELVFFDDMLKCVSDQYSVDAKRVYVTGMSAGGLMTTFLTANRSDKIAASAPFSGGYLHPWPKKAAAVPMLVIWGGAKDAAFAQDFDLLAKALMKILVAKKTFHAMCNHKLGHKIPFNLVPHVWTFLSAHKQGDTVIPFAKGLPKSFPSYCTLPAP